MVFENFAQYTLWGNSGQNIAWSVSLFILSLIVLRFFKYFIIQQLKRISKKTKTDLDDIIIQAVDRINWIFFIIISFYISVQRLAIPELADKIINYVFVIGIVYYAIRFVQNMIDYGTHKAVSLQHKGEKEPPSGTIIHFMARIVKVFLWGIAVVLILSNLGYDVSALLAGLGIGGLAIAFALQNVLGDIFASFSIYLDKPFKPGDFIIIGDDMGVVKRIGIKSTKLESLWGNDIIVSNRELTNIRIHNYRTMKKRRVVLPFGVTYETPKQKLEKIPEMIKEIFKNIKSADLDRVHMKSFAASSLDFELVYYVDSGDYNKHMDIQQQIHFAIKDSFEKEKIEFAYPTRTIFMNK